MTANAVLALLLHKLRSKRPSTSAPPPPSLDALDDATLARLLSLLPLPDLCRARALSRRFCNLIHRRRLLHRRRLRSLLLPGCSPPSLPPGSPSFPLPTDSLLLASAPGLLLLRRRPSDSHLLVFDPASQKSAQIPTPKHGSPSDPDEFFFGLVAGGGLADFSALRGYIDKTSGAGAGAAWGMYKFEMFSAEKGEWQGLKKVSADAAVKFGTTHRGGVFLDGAMHWLGRLNGDSHVLALDLSRGTARKMQVPAPEIGWLGEIDGSLSVGRVRGFVLELWTLTDYLNVEWSRVCRVGFAAPSPEPVGLLGFWGKTAVMVTAGGRVVGYDVEGERWAEGELGVVVGAAQWAVPFSLAPARLPHWDEDWVVVPAEELEEEAAAAMRQYDMLASILQE